MGGWHFFVRLLETCGYVIRQKSTNNGGGGSKFCQSGNPLYIVGLASNFHSAVFSWIPLKWKGGRKKLKISIFKAPLPSTSIKRYKQCIIFRVVLGQPLGGAFLTGDCACAVNVENDVPYAHISFQDEVCEVKQSDKVLTLPITRSKRTEGWYPIISCLSFKWIAGWNWSLSW